MHALCMFTRNNGQICFSFADETRENNNMMVINYKSLTVKVNAFWLREHCPCSECSGANGQRTFNVLDIPLDIEATNVKIDSSKIAITCE